LQGKQRKNMLRADTAANLFYQWEAHSLPLRSTFFTTAEYLFYGLGFALCATRYEFPCHSQGESLGQTGEQESALNLVLSYHHCYSFCFVVVILLVLNLFDILYAHHGQVIALFGIAHEAV
jgi:hypothetical protein